MEGQTHFMWQKNMAQTSDAEGTGNHSLLPYFENSRCRACNFHNVFLEGTQKIIDKIWEDSLVSYFPSHDTILHPSLKSKGKIEGSIHPSIPIRTCCFAIEAWFSSPNWCSMACRKRKGIEMIFNDVYWLHCTESFSVLCSWNKFCMSYHPAWKPKVFCHELVDSARESCASCHCFASFKCISCSLGKRNNAQLLGGISEMSR